MLTNFDYPHKIHIAYICYKMVLLLSSLQIRGNILADYTLLILGMGIYFCDDGIEYIKNEKMQNASTKPLKTAINFTIEVGVERKIL